MSYRNATRAVTAAAGIALVAVGGFGLLAQPHADAAGATPNDICILPGICIPTGGSSSAAPSSSTPVTTGTPSSTPTSTPSDQPSPTVSSPSATYSVAASPTAQQAAATGPAPGPNLAVSHLIVRKVGSKLDVVATITNTGTTLIQNDPVSVSASGLSTQYWTITLNPGQHLSFHTRWPFKASPSVKKVTVVIDPQALNAETNRADNRVSKTKRFG